jgi:hypothetical protein
MVFDPPGSPKSRAWRPRAGLWRNLAGCLFFGMVFATGAIFFLLILSSVLAGDPGDHLEGDPAWKFLWLLLPLPFVLVGLAGLAYVWASRTDFVRSPEQRQVVERAPADFPTVPTVGRGPGSTLAVRLASTAAPVGAAILMLVLLVVCSGVLTPVLCWAFTAYSRGGAEFLPGFLVLFLGLAWALLFGGFLHHLRLSRLPPPTVEVSAQPLYPGDSYELLFRQPGPLRLAALRVLVVCEESATCDDGGDARTETRLVHARTLYDREPAVAGRGTPLEVRATLRVPAGAMHSFRSEHNQVSWVVRVEGRGRGLFRFTNDFPFLVHPPRRPGGGP